MRREQEGGSHQGVRNELLTASALTASRGHLACVWGRRVFCRRRYGSTEDAFGSLEKTRSVLLRLPDARGRNLEIPR